MTISDFLKLPNFTDLRLLAGKYGLLSEVTNVTVVDTPDGTNWLNGGELVITTAYMLHEEKDLLEFLRTLSSKKAAGVGIKENRYLTAPENWQMNCTCLWSLFRKLIHLWILSIRY